MPASRAFLFSILLVFPAFFLSSCLEGDEEYWINADASGRLRMDYKIPPTVVKNLGDYLGLFAALREIDALEDGLKINELSAKLEAGKIHFILDADFNDARDLFSLAEKHADILKKHFGSDDGRLKAAFGKIQLERDGRQLHFRRELDLAPMLPDIIRKNPAILGPATFNYSIHLPTPASSSNAEVTSADKRTLTWHAKLKKHTATPIILELRAPIPYPKWLIPAGITLLMALLFSLRFFWNKRQKRAPFHERS